MPHAAALQRFVDDELGRMPALIEQVRRHTAEALRQPAEAAPSPSERMQRFDLAQALDLHDRRFGMAFVEALARRLAEPGTPGRAVAPAVADTSRSLTLVEDSAHGADLEIGRCAALIGSVAEWELRELQTFTSALCDLPYVSVGANPLRPEAFAHALWQAIDALPQSRHHPLLMRTASRALAEALRRELAAACTRLEAQGVQPSLYRTAVPAQAERPSVLAELLDAPARHADAAAASTEDPAAAELLASLFDAVDQGGQMHPALRALTGLVRGVALGLVRRDPSLLDDARHPLWQWLDRFAYQSATHPNPADPQLLAWVGYATEWVARLQSTPLPDAALLRAGVEQLDAYAAAQFNAQVQQAAPDIERLLRDDPGLAAFDPATLDTVPAHLLDASPAPPGDADVSKWLDAQAPGAWYRLFLRGQWTVVRLLWRSEAGTRWLFASPYPQRHDAFVRGALLRLRAEALVRPLVERAIVVRAAESVRRRLSDPRRAG